MHKNVPSTNCQVWILDGVFICVFFVKTWSILRACNNNILQTLLPLYYRIFFSKFILNSFIPEKEKKEREGGRERTKVSWPLSLNLPHSPTPSLSPSPSCCECVFNKWFICSHIYILQRVREKYSKHKIVLESLPLFKVCS